MPEKTKKAARDIVRTRLENGVTAITERVPDAAQTALGVWVRAGSRYEDLKESGSTHLLQRLAFYGAGDRSAADIAESVDSLGGEIQTDVGRDYGAYLAQIEPDACEAALDLLADLSLRPKVSSAALSAERKKLLEELRTAEKDADKVLEHMFFRSLWKGHGLCRPPQGRLLTVKGQTRLEDFKPRGLQRFHTYSHHPKALVITAAGDFKHEKLLEMIRARFEPLEEPNKTVSTVTPTAYKFLALRNRPQFTKVRFQLGVPASAVADSERYAAALLNAVLGGGSGSRLAKMLMAEELPAEEAVSKLDQFVDVGCLSIKLRASRKHAAEALEKTVGELKKLALGTVDEEELKRARATCKAQLLKVLESPASRIRDLAQRERYFGKATSLEDDIAALEKVTPGQLKGLAAGWFAPHHLSVAVLGNLKGVDIKPKMLRW